MTTAGAAHPDQPLLSVRNLKKWFPITRGVFNQTVGHVKAVDDVSFDLYPGECLGLVGESGSGKTTVGRCVLRAIDPTDGQIMFHHNGTRTDLATLSRRRIKPLRRHMQMIFQDPYASLNPRMTIFDIVSEPLLIHGMRSRKQRQARVKELMAQVGLNPQHLNRHPHAFSGGQRQRIGIARALALSPSLIVADEPVSALDVSVQAQVLNLLGELQEAMNLTYLFVAHDLTVVRHLCDRIAVMYVGRLVETGPVDTLFARPAHPYTQALLSSVPAPNPKQRSQPIALTGEVADPSARPAGCAFHPRCHLTRQLAAQADALDVTPCEHEGLSTLVMRRCVDREPALADVGGRQQSACHYSEHLMPTVEGAALSVR